MNAFIYNKLYTAGSRMHSSALSVLAALSAFGAYSLHPTLGLG